MSEGKGLIVLSNKIDVEKALTGEGKRALSRIIEDEFSNQTTLLSKKEGTDRNAVIEKWKKKFNIEKRVAVYDALAEKLKKAGKDIESFGFTISGDLHYNSAFYPKELKDELDGVAEAYSGPRTTRNKILARLWMAKTQGEALEILRAVMGNGILPDPEKLLGE
jgi:hypothetical protein